MSWWTDSGHGGQTVMYLCLKDIACGGQIASSVDIQCLMSMVDRHCLWWTDYHRDRQAEVLKMYFLLILTIIFFVLCP